MCVCFFNTGAKSGTPQAVVSGGGSAVHRGADSAATEHALSGPTSHRAGCGGKLVLAQTHTHTLFTLF